MRARGFRDASSSSSNDRSSEDPKDKKFKPEHGKKLAYTSLLALLLSALSAVWYPLLQTQPKLIFATLIVSHVIVVFSMGNSFLPCHILVWYQACAIGASLAVGLIVAIYGSNFFPFGIYIVVLTLFHFGEFFVTGLTNPENLSLDSFLLNHSIAYWVAAIASWIEFFLEAWFLPSIKSFKAIIVIGLIVCVLGDGLRKLAMFHAGKSFSHIVQYLKKEDHKLVTDGVYKVFRHPSYVGWFYWSIGTQIILCNPVCLIAYAMISWKFFDERIFVEEATLLNFFGSDYLRYQKRVPIGIPFIKGFRDVDEN